METSGYYERLPVLQAAAQMCALFNYTWVNQPRRGGEKRGMREGQESLARRMNAVKSVFWQRDSFLTAPPLHFAFEISPGEVE